MTGRQDLFEESMQLGHSAAWDLDWVRAVDFYRKALAEMPEDPGGLTSLGLALLETGQLKEALATYHKATKSMPEDPMPIEKCAEIFEILGQTKDAIKQRHAAAKLYLRRKNAEKALENWIHIARMVPGNHAARSRLAMTYERLGRRGPAIHEYLALASILQRRGNVDQAMEAVHKALAVSPGEPSATEALSTLQAGKPLPRPAKPIGAEQPIRLRKSKEPPADLKPEPEEQQEEHADPEEAAQKVAISTLASLVFDEPREGDPDEETRPSASSRGRRSGLSSARRPRKYRYLSEAINLQSQGHASQAAKELKRAIDAGLEHPAAHYNLGLLMKQSGNLKAAQDHLSKSVDDKDYSLGAFLALGRIARSEGDLPQATQYLLQALKHADNLTIEEDQTGRLNELYDGIISSRKEGDQEALSHIVENTLAFLSGPEWMERVQQARERLRIHEEGSKVVPIAEILTMGGSERVYQSLSRVDSLISAGKMDTAMEEAMLALDEAPDYLAIHMRMAAIMIEGGRTKQGMEKVSFVAETYRLRGEIEKAVQAYTRALELSPVNLKARSRLIELLTQQNRSEEVLDQYLELSSLLRQMAQIDEARQSLAEAFRIAQETHASDEQQMQILGEMVDIDMSRLDWTEALRNLEQMLALDPSNKEVQLKAIDLGVRMGKEQQAVKRLDGYLETLVKENRSAEVLQVLEEQVREHPEMQAFRMRLAKAYQAAGRTTEAVAQYDALGELLINAGQTDKAIATIQEIIALEPPEMDDYRQLLAELESRELGSGSSPA